MKGVTLYRPNTIENALNDFDRYFESFFGESPLSGSARFLSRLPAVDVRETEKAFVLEMDLPGYSEKDIEVHVDGNSLTIESPQEKAAEETKKEGAYILRERHASSFSRSFKLPQNADPDAVSAGFNNGVLCLEIKKRAETQKKVIQINKN
jgi:HSP20 family protein